MSPASIRRGSGGKPLSLPTAVATCFSKYTTFSGRAPRSEYWWFYLFGLICALAGLVVDVGLGVPIVDGRGEFTGGPVFWLVILALFLPYLSVSIRRMHDIDRSGWWVFIPIIPVVGTIVYLVFTCTRGTDGENDYGPEFSDTSVAGVFE